MTVQVIGHRARLRMRFLAHGCGSLHDYERLELLLTYVLPRQDTKALAKKLIERHQGLRNVLLAAQSTPDVVSERFQVLVQMCLLDGMWEGSAHTQMITSVHDMVNYVLPLMSKLSYEQLRVLYMGSQGRIIYEHVIDSVWSDRVSGEIPTIVRVGLLYKAHALLVAHNHPSGDPTPSHADYVFTHKLQQACTAVNLVLADHLVIAGKNFQSCLPVNGV
ncbi:MAG: hypothetical protein H6849_01140 [Alphaproteobacteria bacterium]|nr:MAG: hypothetical protein H6849_01140 [Alphaproteobacteria bacterium]